MNTERELTPAALKARFAYMFPEESSLGISFARGWLPLFERLCAEIDSVLGEERRRFHWVQVKEKYGSARFYWQLGRYDRPIAVDIIGPEATVSVKLPKSRRRRPVESDETLMERIGEIVRAAEDETRNICIACGELGQVDDTGGYLLVLCPEHGSHRRSGRLLRFWLDECN
jgi:hypothetical protein